MKLSKLDRKAAVLLILLAVALLGDLWYGQDTWRARGEAQGLEGEIAKDRDDLRRLRTIAQLADIKKQLDELQKKAPRGLQQPLPPSTDAEQLNREVELLGTNPPGGRASYKWKDSKTDTIDGAAVQIVTYEVTLLGNASDLLAMLRRIDESKLLSLKIQTFSVDRQPDNWLMKLALALYLQAPPPPPGATPAPKSG